MGPTVRAVGEVKKEEKTRKETRHWQTGYSPRPPTLSQRHMHLLMWSCPGSSYIFQVSSKSVQWFQSHRCRNLPFPIDLASGLYTACTTVYSCPKWPRLYRKTRRETRQVFNVK